MRLLSDQPTQRQDEVHAGNYAGLDETYEVEECRCEAYSCTLARSTGYRLDEVHAGNSAGMSCLASAAARTRSASSASARLLASSSASCLASSQLDQNEQLRADEGVYRVRHSTVACAEHRFRGRRRGNAPHTCRSWRAHDVLVVLVDHAFVLKVDEPVEDTDCLTKNAGEGVDEAYSCTLARRWLHKHFL